MGTKRGVIQRSGPNYSYGGQRWNGKEAMILALEDDRNLVDNILKDLHKADLAGEWRTQDIQDAMESMSEDDVDRDETQPPAFGG